MPEFEVTWLRSKATGKQFPIAVLVGDTDMGMDEWLPLTSTQKPEIVIVHLKPSEREDDAVDRANRSLGRSDLKYVQIKSCVENTNARGKSFQEFRAADRPPTLTYSDIYATPGDAEVIDRITRATFEADGGSVLEI